jgi:cytochrome c peroxidase
VAVLLGCGGSDGGAEPGDGDGFPGVAEYLTLDLARPANYANPAWPAHYDAFTLARDNDPPGNPVTDRGATLGRVLFHDVRLSRTDNVSCATCHEQALGFTDALPFSVGLDGVQRTAFRSMRLANARFAPGGAMFWNRRAPSVEAQATQPIRDPIEMGFDDAHGGIAALVAKMGALSYYPELFRWAFGDAAITEERIRRALAQYVRSIVSTGSRFDDGFAARFDPALPDLGLAAPFASFTAEENRGKALFMRRVGDGGAGCARCHVPPTFAQQAGVGGNGLDPGETVVFRSPSLKSVAVTGPYMHDGRFGDLLQVIEHYDSGVQDGPAVDGLLRQPGGMLRLGLSDDDKRALVAFLGTLTDTRLVDDARFSSPFRP